MINGGGHPQIFRKCSFINEFSKSIVWVQNFPENKGAFIGDYYNGLSL
jgi:hypothetical protein